MLQVARGSWFEPLAHLRSQLAGVLCNPPYIPSADISHLQVVQSVTCNTSPYSYRFLLKSSRHSYRRDWQSYDSRLA